MSQFQTIDVVSVKPIPQNAIPADGREFDVETFTMNVRGFHVAAYNVVNQPPSPEVKSIVYFDADSGLKPVLSSETVPELAAKFNA